MIIHFIRRFYKCRNSNLTVRLLSVISAALTLNVGFGILFYIAESGIKPELTLVDSIWWAMVTMTTVGYGDIFAETWQGRFLVSYPCFIFGIGLIGYLLGMLAENMIEITSRRKKGLSKIRMKEHLIICHCPSTSKILHIVSEIRAVSDYLDTAIVVISDKLEERPQEFLEKNISFVNGNPEDIDILRKANVESAKGVIILASAQGESNSDASTFTIASSVEFISEETGKDIITVAELLNEKSGPLFKKTKIDGAVTVEGLTDKMMVQELLHPGIHNTFNQLLTNTAGSQLYTCKTKLVGKKLVNIQTAALAYEGDLQIIGLKRGDQQLLNPNKQIIIEEGDQLIVLAESATDFTSFETFKLSQS